MVRKRQVTLRQDKIVLFKLYLESTDDLKSPVDYYSYSLIKKVEVDVFRFDLFLFNELFN